MKKKPIEDQPYAYYEKIAQAVEDKYRKPHHYGVSSEIGYDEIRKVMVEMGCEVNSDHQDHDEVRVLQILGRLENDRRFKDYGHLLGEQTQYEENLIKARGHL
jgi:hypothetical protein